MTRTVILLAGLYSIGGNERSGRAAPLTRCNRSNRKRGHASPASMAANATTATVATCAR